MGTTPDNWNTVVVTVDFILFNVVLVSIFLLIYNKELAKVISVSINSGLTIETLRLEILTGK